MLCTGHLNKGSECEIRFTKSCKNSIEYPYVLHPESPKINILHNRSTIIKTIDTIILLLDTPCSNFVSCAIHVLFLFQGPIQDFTLRLVVLDLAFFFFFLLFLIQKGYVFLGKLMSESVFCLNRRDVIKNQ